MVTTVRKPAPPPSIDELDVLEEIFAAIAEQLPEVASGPQRVEAVKAIIRERFAGIEVYVPRRPVAERRQLDRRIAELFDGRNATEVARRLGISRATVYRKLKQPGR